MALTLVSQMEHERQRVASAIRAHRIDQLVPDRREAVLAAEKYLDQQSAYGKVMDQRLKIWRTGLGGDFVSHAWLKSINR